MTELLTRLLGRLPIGWLQLTHSRARLAAALAGVAFANVLIFMQLGFLGALVETVGLPYRTMNADILIQSSDASTLQDGSPLPRQRMFQALAVQGVASATSVYFGRIDWKQPDGTIRNLDVFGIDPTADPFRSPEIVAAREQLQVADVALIDRMTRNALPSDLFERIDAGTPFEDEVRGRRLTFSATFTIGGGFSADGYMVVSDQTFLRLFPTRMPGAPNLIFVRTTGGSDVAAVVERLNTALPASDSKARTVAAAAEADQTFQTTQKPVGIVFGFGAVIGVLVGIIIVYQVLSTDVSDHLREYATLKAIGYRQSYFLGIVFEEALVLALIGFIPGLLVATLLYAAVNSATGLPVAMTPARPFLVFVGTVLMCTVSGAIATRRLARADPADLF